MSTRGSRRSFTGNHEILPAAEARVETLMSIVPDREFISWTFGRGTVIHRIWPAVLLHTIFAAIITTISLKTKYWLGIPSVMLTVLGLILGFVISYRASSGYDRFWMGRGGWGDVIRTSRTLARVIWFHVPLRLGPNAKKSGVEVDGVVVEEDEEVEEEAEIMMAEKLRALDLVQAFVISLKHHLRGEAGVYYEDLYPLMRAPRHHHMSRGKKSQSTPEELAAQLAGSSALAAPPGGTGKSKKTRTSVYGTFEATTTGNVSTTTTLVRRPSGSGTAYDSDRSSCSSDSDDDRSSEQHTLLPSRTRKQSAGYFGHANADLIPFETFFSAIGRGFARVGRAFRGREKVYKFEEMANRSRKHRPRVAGGGQNLPLEILRGFSEWAGVLEDRGAVPGSALGTIYGSIAAYEDQLSTLEKILTTPLPFVFSCHLRHTVWLYLFFLPFQLVRDFGWFTIPGVAVASFIYLGFLAVGDEIEQPFGYEENDLELDLFCHDVVMEDVAWLKRTPCRNAQAVPQVGGEEVQVRNVLISIANERTERHVRQHKRKTKAAAKEKGEH